MKLEVKKLMPESKISWFATLFFHAIAVGLLAILLPGQCYRDCGGEIGATVGFAVFFLPLTRLMHARSKEGSLQRETKLRFQEFVGPNADYIDTDIALVPGRRKRFSGTGIALKEGKIYMMDSGMAAHIPWNFIRSWRYEIQGVERSLVGVTNYSGVLVPQYSENREEAYRGSGFFVTVADIEYPEWQFQTMNKNLAKKWLEIFNQINEGKIQAS
jgi:hypothetical protein